MQNLNGYSRALQTGRFQLLPPAGHFLLAAARVPELRAPPKGRRLVEEEKKQGGLTRLAHKLEKASVPNKARPVFELGIRIQGGAISTDRRAFFRVSLFKPLFRFGVFLLGFGNRRLPLFFGIVFALHFGNRSFQLFLSFGSFLCLLLEVFLTLVLQTLDLLLRSFLRLHGGCAYSESNGKPEQRRKNGLHKTTLHYINPSRVRRTLRGK
ncbi:MAG: hypothetical protein ACLPPF_08745 [Rhodomicrobium sp.]